MVRSALRRNLLDSYREDWFITRSAALASVAAVDLARRVAVRVLILRPVLEQALALRLAAQHRELSAEQLVSLMEQHQVLPALLSPLVAFRLLLASEQKSSAPLGLPGRQQMLQAGSPPAHVLALARLSQVVAVLRSKSLLVLVVAAAQLLSRLVA